MFSSCYDLDSVVNPSKMMCLRATCNLAGSQQRADVRCAHVREPVAIISRLSSGGSAPTFISMSEP